MGTHLIPRDTKGEDRILMIFSRKAFIYSIAGLIIGFLLYMFFSAISLGIVGIIIGAVIVLFGFIIGTFKIPKIEKFKVTTYTEGENIDEIVIRAIKFKNKKIKKYTLNQGGKDE